MNWICLPLAVVFLSVASPKLTIAASHAQASTPVHDRQFWRDLAKNHYAIPPDQSAAALATELSANLASPDPELRDDLAYSIFYVWIVRQNKLSPADLVTLLDQWESNLRIGIGESGTDTVFLRSFSALCLATLAERDLKSPFFGEQRFRSLLTRSLEYLHDERDLRGFDPVKGWIHSGAHTADLLAFLAANPLLKLEDQSRILQGVSERLSSAAVIFSYGEQDRLANTVATIVARQDFDPAAFQNWLSALDESDRNVWKNSPPNGMLLMTYQNNSYMLQSLVARLYSQPKSPAATAALDQVTQILQKR